MTRARFAVAINNRYFLLFDDGTILPTRNNLAGRAVSLMRSVIAVLLLAVTLSWAQRTPAQMDVRPIFGTTVPPYGCLPLRIIVQNDGPSVDATLVVEPSRWQAERRHLIPLPLPTGTRKEVIALPFILPNTMSVRVWLEGFRPTVEQTLSVTPDENARVVVAVGDEIGGLEFLHRLNPQQQNPPSPAPQPLFIWSWTYCRPESLPDKTAAFSGVSVVVLASGAERLTPAQWQALRRWVAMGGVLIAPGGSGAIYLRHIALATILPIRDGRIQRWSDWRSLAFFAQAKTPMGETFVTAGKPAEGAKVLVGADKVSLNTAAVQNPDLIREAAERFGSQCVVVAIDAKRVGRDFRPFEGDERFEEGCRWEVYIHGGRTATGLDALEWAVRAVELGAGEILLTSMDADGAQAGYDIGLTKKVAEAVSVPVIASGGAGTLEHIYEALTVGKAQAALIASLTHYGKSRIADIKNYLAQKGILVRRNEP